MFFRHQYDENSPLIELTLPRDIELSEVREEFMRFLVLVGYHPDSIKKVFGDDEER
jgi:hypothetical protein